MIIQPKFLFVLLVSISLSGADEWDGFVGKFVPCIFCSSGFFDLPVTQAQAVSADPPYVDSGFKDPEFNLDIYCLKNDPHVCLLFDLYGSITGLRISHLKKEVASDLKNFPYKYDSISLFTSTTFMGEDLWYTNFLFTKPANLIDGQGMHNVNATAEGLWVRLDSGWTEIPRDECAARQSGWKEQGFIPWMGKHYSIGQTDDCSTFIPLLPLYHYGRLIALAFTAFGKYTPVDRSWFEKVPSCSIPWIIPDGYKPCLQDWTKKYTVSSFHFYLVKHPRLIFFNSSPKCE